MTRSNPFANLVMLIGGVEDDQRRVSGDLKLGVGYRRAVVHHHHDVLGLGQHCRHIHRPGGAGAHTRTQRNQINMRQKSLK